ncbi:MAG: LD-carboxypeptidase [bacterium]|nr:LD-carboxypeptidase [bacterium]
MDAERLAVGVGVLEGLGFRVVVGERVLARRGYLAGSDDDRRSDLQRMLDDEGIHAVFCARGGYGSQRVVPGLDLETLVRAPKPVVGYSDATALLSALVEAGVGAVHGPMISTDVARGLLPRSLQHLHRLLTEPDYRWEMEAPVTIRPGTARGPLLGGCLSVLVTLLGTPWTPRFDGAVLFLEDVHEWPYRLDRLLTQLRQAGSFDRIAGVVFGSMAACRAQDGLDALAVARDAFTGAHFPVAFGLPAGHDPAESDVENLALPLGTLVELDADAGRLRALEGAVA